MRSLRYGESDRILHLYTPSRGRIGAIAKGVRRTRSFGGRLEPFCRVRLVCHEGRGELLTVTGVETEADEVAFSRSARRRTMCSCMSFAPGAASAAYEQMPTESDARSRRSPPRRRSSRFSAL